MKRRRLLAVLLAVAASLALGATAAQAHAVLERAWPSDGETLETAPDEVRLEFSEPVSAPVGAVRVFNTEGNRVDTGQTMSADRGAAIVAPLRDGIGEGTHVVTWRAVSADGHPVKGAFVFHVGERGEPVDDSVLASLLGSGNDRPFAIGAGVARWVTYLASLLAIGAFVFRVLVSDRETADVIRVIRLGCLVGATAALAQIPLFAIESTGLGVSAFTSGSVWGDALSGTVGMAALIRVGAFALLYAVAARSVWSVGWLAVGGLILAELVTGHTRTTDPAWVVWAADAFHVAGAAVWFGGLVALVATLRRRRGEDDPVEAARVVGRFSTMAAWAVVGLGLAGATMAWSQVRTWHAATSTIYGWTLITKVGIVAGVLLLALYNNRVLVPAITTHDAGDDRGGAWGRLGKTIRWEIAGIVLVLGITAMLVNIQPAAEAAGVSGPYSTFVPFGEGQLNLVVDPNRTGSNEIHLYLLTPGGLPAITQGEVVLEMSLPRQDIGPIVRSTQFAGPGHFLHTGPELALPGTWEVTVRQRVSEFEEDAVTIPVVVND